MEKAPSKARLFVALDLPADARDAIVEWRSEAFGGRDDLRLVPPEALHVTLAFLGHLPEEEIARTSSLLDMPRGAAPALAATGIKAVPPRRTRLFALDLADEGGRATEIQSTISDALASAGLYEPEARPFWPHVTLARVKKGAVVRGIELPPPPAEVWQAEAVTLYRSRLSPRGANYEPLERIGFG